MEIVATLFRVVLFILPSYFANSTPVLLGGGVPIDGGKNWSDSRRIFGNGKTVRGFFTGIFAGVFVGALEAAVLSGTEWNLYATPSDYILVAFLLSVGTMAGDLLGSFVKRRQGISQGKPSLLLDQLTFIVLALLLAYPLAAHLYSLESVLFLLVLTYFVHVGANIFANRLGLKKVPW